MSGPAAAVEFTVLRRARRTYQRPSLQITQAPVAKMCQIFDSQVWRIRAVIGPAVAGQHDGIGPVAREQFDPPQPGHTSPGQVA
jgi:hypothetical protein